MITPAATEVKAYADRFLAVLERIAVALEALDTAPITHKPASNAEVAARDLAFKALHQEYDGNFSTPAAGAPPDATSKPSVAAQGSISYDTVRAAVMAFQDRSGAAAAQNVLKSFGARYILDLKAHPEKYAEVLAALR